ncbi:MULTISPECIES: ROK family protein [unclassified Rhodococcus (in: high G+C Gram-positive bacteria)]|uniref:ROK family protein n=1 Tax=unclassified Rhodococcus (in: high G+C Gram-positive bacteria) TaxID=192944 RepID=UPI000926E7BE|nr:ROK family protein [Rhodococcus sp. M8]OLL20632.1 glucokinase [Rhodococcus sp. M8]QPG44481.1 ROK family protein [Rhodococcus sp. M8]
MVLHAPDTDCAADETTPHAIGIDVGGTNIRASVVDEHGRILAETHRRTPSSADALSSALVSVVDHLATGNPVDAVGVAVAGFVARDRATVTFAPHLPWRDAPVAAELTARVGLPVIVEHDVNSAAWAEYRFGAGASGENVVTLALGTGIGAALMVSGTLYRGSFGVAAELGHLQVVPGGRACPCGKRGCWERYCSGTALVETAVSFARRDPRAPGALSAAALTAPDNLDGHAVAAAARDGDPLALSVFGSFAYWLGVGLAVIQDIYDPDAVLLTGGVSESADLYLDTARAVAGELRTGGRYRRGAQVRVAELGASASRIGAADLARTLIPNPR